MHGNVRLLAAASVVLMWPEVEGPAGRPADRPCATFSCSFQQALQQWVRISGDKAILEVDDMFLDARGSEPWKGASFRLASFDFGDDHRSVTRNVSEFAAEPCNQEALMFEAFCAACADDGDRDFWKMVAMSTQAIMDAALESAARGGDEVEVQAVAR